MRFHKELKDMIKEVLYSYGARYGNKKGLCKILLFGGDFLIVDERDSKVLVDGEWVNKNVLDEIQNFDDFCLNYIKAFQTNNFNDFTSRYFKPNNNFNIIKNDEKIYVLSWGIVGKSLGDRYYERPGAILSFEVNYFTTFLFFSFIGDKDKYQEDYFFEEDLKALKEYVRKLDDYLGFE